MNLWNENEILQKERRIEIGKGKRLRGKLLEIRTRRQALQAEMKNEREIFEVEQHDNKVWFTTGFWFSASILIN
jgi:hypothetical protein